MKSNLSPAAKRKLATVQQTQADPVLQSLIEDAAAAHHFTMKKVLVVDVGGTAVKIFAMGQRVTEAITVLLNRAFLQASDKEVGDRRSGFPYDGKRMPHSDSPPL